MAWMVSQLTPRPSPPLVFCGCTGSSRLHNHGNTAPGRLSSSEPLVDKPEKTRSICKIVKNSQTRAGSERHERGINNDRIFIFGQAFPLTQKQSTAVVIEWQMTRAKTRRATERYQMTFMRFYKWSEVHSHLRTKTANVINADVHLWINACGLLTIIIMETPLEREGCLFMSAENRAGKLDFQMIPGDFYLLRFVLAVLYGTQRDRGVWQQC